MAFANMVLTTEGMMLYAKAQQGKRLHITRVVVGDGVLAPGESMVNRSGLKSQWASFLIDHVHIDSASAAAEIVFTMSNDSLEEERYFRELGVVAEDPDTKEDKLYLYDYDGVDAERIPSSHESTKVFERIKLILRLENTPNVTFALSGNPLYLTSDDIDDEAEGPGVLWSSLKVAEVVRNKQEKITGTMGQVVGFNKNGEPVPMDAPQSLPAGGTVGQVLGKTGEEDGQAGWQDAVGRSMAGQEVEPAQGTIVTAGDGAEIFNDYRDREYGIYQLSGVVYVKSGNIANGKRAHAEGERTTASGDYAHAEGVETVASGYAAHAEGFAKATGMCSHASGGGNATGEYSFAAGTNTYAKSRAAFALGYQVIASAEGQMVVGSFNAENTSYYSKFIVGGGADSNNRANCFRVTTNQGVFAKGNYNSSGADYAELFEWLDGNPDRQDRAGLFVTLQGDRIRIASPGDDYILGIVSGSPSVVGDVYDDQWAGMFLTDIFGRPIYEDVDLPAELGPGGEVILPERTERRQKLNPAYDHTKKYLPRTQRPEWDAVGLLGKLVAVDDGTCVPDGWCTVGPGGIATASRERTKYRVMARLDENHIRVMIL